MYCSCNYSTDSGWSARPDELQFLPKHDFSWDKRKDLLQKSKLVAIATHTTAQLLPRKSDLVFFFFSTQAHLSSGNMLHTSCKYIPISHQGMVGKNVFFY